MPPGDKPSGLDTGFTEATIQTAPPAAADVHMARCITPPFGMERENWYLLVITTSIEQLSLGPSGDNPQKSSTAHLEEICSKIHGWLLFSLGQPGWSVIEVPL